MKWIEIIRIRSYGSRERELATDAFHRLNLSHFPAGLDAVKLHRHAAIESDISVSLFWAGNEFGSRASELGTRLARAFAAFGMIDHTVWAEDTVVSPTEKQ